MADEEELKRAHRPFLQQFWRLQNAKWRTRLSTRQALRVLGTYSSFQGGVGGGGGGTLFAQPLRIHRMRSA